MTELTPPRDTTDTEAIRDEVEALCVLFHNAYEDAALDHGWETQEDSRKPWDDVPEANKQTMRATIASLLAAGYSLPDPARDAALRAEAWEAGVSEGQVSVLHVLMPPIGDDETRGPQRLLVVMQADQWIEENERNPYDDPDRPSGHTRSCAAVGCGPECEAPR